MGKRNWGDVIMPILLLAFYVVIARAATGGTFP